MSRTRRLIVMRHAKSSWASGAQSDHQRPLNDRGRRDAPRVATALVDVNWLPDLILSSDAQRTRETYDGMAVSFPCEIPVQFLFSFYLAGLEAVLNESPGVADEIETLMVLGHNPGWQEIVARLSGHDVAMKTANAALLEAQGTSWHEALRSFGAWDLVEVISPKDLD